MIVKPWWAVFHIKLALGVAVKSTGWVNLLPSYKMEIMVQISVMTDKHTDRDMESCLVIRLPSTERKGHARHHRSHDNWYFYCLFMYIASVMVAL